MYDEKIIQWRRRRHRSGRKTSVGCFNEIKGIRAKKRTRRISDFILMVLNAVITTTVFFVTSFLFAAHALARFLSAHFCNNSELSAPLPSVAFVHFSASFNWNAAAVTRPVGAAGGDTSVGFCVSISLFLQGRLSYSKLFRTTTLKVKVAYA